MPEFILKTTKEDYDAAGSRFITFPPGAKAGDLQYRQVEIGMMDWDTPDVSLKIPVTVTEVGPDFKKEEKLSFGVNKAGIWKGKTIYLNVTGKDMPMKMGSDKKAHPAPKSEDLLGKTAIGVWVMQEGHKGGDPNAEKTLYPKLMDLLAPGTEIPKSGDLGI
jgi:hypothetical protein